MSSPHKPSHDHQIPSSLSSSSLRFEERIMISCPLLTSLTLFLPLIQHHRRIQWTPAKKMDQHFFHSHTHTTDSETREQRGTRLQPISDTGGDFFFFPRRLRLLIHNRCRGHESARQERGIRTHRKREMRRKRPRKKVGRRCGGYNGTSMPQSVEL